MSRLDQGMPAVILAAVLSIMAAPADAAQVADTKRRELGRVQRELQETRADIERFRKLEHSLRQDADRLEENAARTRKKLSSIQGDLSRAEDRKRSLRSRLGALREAEGLWRALIGTEAARYLIERSAGEGASGASSLWKERLRRAAIIEKGTLLTALAGAASKTSRLEAEAVAAQRRLGEAKDRVAAEKLATEAEFRGKKAEMDGLKEKTQAATLRAAELEESAKALQRMIESITRLSKVSAHPGSIRLPKHSLPWPAEGRLAGKFGKEKDPKTGSWVINQGVRLEAAAGAPVRAVAAGTVIFAGPFRSYGQVIIVNHGGFFSVYGELGEVAKRKTDRVAAGETIARAGAGRLYFEVRSGSEALDPLQWLQKR
ncbi:MAG: peptidoglycan DD-metalloendopeptidase family protein [Elusimicrobia bacterium]|nr:peptidoglycan DD-metalloendopeptidase family protein [Elusimicrobiota bacterium]